MEKVLKIPLLTFPLFATCYLLFATLVSPVKAAVRPPPTIVPPLPPDYLPAGCYYQGDVARLECLAIYIQNIISFLFPLAAAVALLFLLFGGIRFITSGGEPKAAETAKKTMTYAILGLAVIFLVWFIFQIIRQATGVDLTRFNIVVPTPGP